MRANTYHQQTAKFVAQVATCMPHILSDVMQDWIKNPRALKQALAKALHVTLRSMGTIFLDPAAQDFSPRTFFQKRVGLEVEIAYHGIWGIPGVDQTNDPTLVELKVFELPWPISNLRIKAMLPLGHNKIELWHIAQLIEKQKHGEKGWLSTERTNIFYIGDYQVNLSWYADRSIWYVQGINRKYICNRGPIDDQCWPENARIFISIPRSAR